MLYPRKKILIIGLGIGAMYQRLLRSTGNYDVLSIDTDPMKQPDFLDLDSFRRVHPMVDLAIVCVPNFLHSDYVFKLHDMQITNTVLVEKPGLEDLSSWVLHSGMYTDGKLLMTKNNLYRDSYASIHKTIDSNILDITEVNVLWLNKNRIPNPGSWFTNKKLAFGGVSRDLMPHLLSVYYELFKEFPEPISCFKSQRHTLDDIESTGYGSVVKTGVYNVDDYCRIEFKPVIHGNPIHSNLIASWKTDIPESRIGIEIVWANKNRMFYELGLCPEPAYLKMIEAALTMDASTYETHKHIDAWIHNILDNVD